MGIRDFVRMVSVDLGSFIKEHMPCFLVCPKPYKGKHLMCGENDLPFVIGLFQIFGKCSSY